MQKDVLALMREIQREMRSSMLFVTHDMSVHANMADRLGIMYAGRLVEEAPTAELFARALHPYTQHLIQSLPRIGDSTPRKGLHGAPPNLSAPPPGCRFHPRCPVAMDICRTERPALTTLSPGHRVACFAASPAVKPVPDKTAPAAGMSGDLLSVETVTRTYAMGGLFGRGALRRRPGRQLRDPGRDARDLHRRRRVRQRQVDARAR